MSNLPPFPPSSDLNKGGESGVGKAPSQKLSGRTRGPAPQSCTECRRMKLKCSRTSPCASCLKRGVADRCVGAISADTQSTDPASLLLSAATSSMRELQERNEGLEHHVRQLKQALLDALHGDKAVWEPAHPLHEEIVALKHQNKVTQCVGGDEYQATAVENFGTLSIPERGKDHASWLGSTASSELFIRVKEEEQRAAVKTQRVIPASEGLPVEFMILGRIYMLTSSSEGRGTGIRGALRSMAPIKEVALALCDNYFVYGSWFSAPICRQEFMTEIFNPLYDSPIWDDLPYDKIALLFAVFSVGVTLDFSLEPHHPDAYRYYKIGAAALGMSEFIESPSIITAQALIVTCTFHIMSDDPDGPARAWAVSGLLIRMTQSLGMHRDMTALGMKPKELQRRSRIWWETVFLDKTQSFFYGRPSGISHLQYDCPLPEPTPLDETFRTEKYKLLNDHLNYVIEVTLNVKPPTYAHVLKFDKLLRVWKSPDIPKIQGLPTPKTMSIALQAYAVHSIKETTILYLHRSAFVQALKEGGNPLSHKFMPSVLAVHQSATLIIQNLKSLVSQYPSIVPRCFVYALHAFSASVLLAAIVAHSPNSTLAPSSMAELESACDVLAKCTDSVRIDSAMTIMYKLRDIARRSYADYITGAKVGIKEEDVEELTRLVGFTRIVSNTGSSEADSPSTHSSVGQTEPAVVSAGYPQTGYAQSGPVPNQPHDPYAWATAEILPSLAPGQLPLPLDGINFGWNVQPDMTNDPLSLLSMPWTPGQNIYPGQQSYDYIT